MKRCNGKCKQLLDESCFSKCNSNKDGLQYQCKTCERVYRQSHKEEHKAYLKPYYKAHKNGLSAYGKSWRQDRSYWCIWWAMIQRCNNPKCKVFKNYGGRGIKVLYRNFNEFLTDVGPKPGPKYSIDRIDNDGNYEPGNCKWSTAKEQANNERVSIFV